MNFPVSDDYECDFVVKDTARFGDDQDIYAFGYMLNGGQVELYYPGIYECPDVKISDSYSQIMAGETFDSKVADGQLVEVKDADVLPYDARGFYQPELFDEVYAGNNPEIIHHVEKMREMLGEKYGTRVEERNTMENTFEGASLPDACREAEGAAQHDDAFGRPVYENQLVMTPNGPVAEVTFAEHEHTSHNEEYALDEQKSYPYGDGEISLKEFLKSADSLNRENTARDEDIPPRDVPAGHDEL